MDVNTGPASDSAPAPELSIDEIVTAALKDAENAGTPVVADDTPAATTAPASAAPAGDAPTETPAAEEPKGDEISAARARKILEAATERQAQLDAREAQITAREAQGMADMLAQLLKAPKSFLAKHGKHIDDLIDASVAEGKGEPAEAEPVDPRITALEERINRREADEAARANQALIDNRKAEIHNAVKSAAGKFPLLAKTDRAQTVTDFMVEYHGIHGKPIAWDKAAALVEADLKALVEKGAESLGWTKPAAKTDPPAPAARANTTSLSGPASTAAPTTDEELPEDPTVLMDYLVKRATNGLLKTA